MTTLAITAATNFALAAEALVLGCLVAKTAKRRMAAWYFGGVLLFLGGAAFLGGVDHGFLEPGNVPRFAVQRITWMLLGAATFCLLMTTAKQFFPERWHRPVFVIAAVQLAVNTAIVLRVDSFLDVILNYAPVMLLFLAMNLAKGGSWQMIAGLLLQIAASAVQAMNVDLLSPLDHNGLYHLVSTAAVLFFYWGARRMPGVR